MLSFGIAEAASLLDSRPCHPSGRFPSLASPLRLDHSRELRQRGPLDMGLLKVSFQRRLKPATARLVLDRFVATAHCFQGVQASPVGVMHPTGDEAKQPRTRGGRLRTMQQERCSKGAFFATGPGFTTLLR